MRASRVHIAGVGVSGPENANANLDERAVAAGTKALLDAGATWTNVDQCVVCFDESAGISPASLDLFGATGTAVAQVHNKSGLFTTAQFVASGQRHCVLMIGTDGNAIAVGIVLVSDLFLTSRAYLKDSAVQIKACNQVGRIRIRSSKVSPDLLTTKTAVQAALRDASLSAQDVQILSLSGGTKTTKQAKLSELAHTHPQKQPRSLTQVTGSTGLSSLCALVWQLRGWASSDSAAQVQNCLLNTIHDDGANTVLVLSRSDVKAAPKWETIKDLRDGRERLGYNPALEMRRISQEDVAAVRADQAFAGGEGLKRLQLPIKGGDRAALARL